MFICRRTSPATGLCSSRRKHRSDRDQATAEWFVSLSVTTDQSRCCDVLFCHSERSEAQSRKSLAVLFSTKKLEMSRLLDMTEERWHGHVCFRRNIGLRPVRPIGHFVRCLESADYESAGRTDWLSLCSSASAFRGILIRSRFPRRKALYRNRGHHSCCCSRARS